MELRPPFNHPTSIEQRRLNFSRRLVNRRSVQQDILTSLLPEILLKIISQPPSKNCLDLTQSCQFLHNFVKLKAGRICNEAIRRHSPIEAAPLKSGLEAEWLVSMHTQVSAEQFNYRVAEDGRCVERKRRGSGTGKGRVLGGKSRAL